MSKIHKAIEIVGDRGKYQKTLLVLFILVYLELGLMLLGSTFIYMNPTYDCPNITEPTQDQACDPTNQCIMTNTFTVTHYAQLTCDRQDDRSLIQSAPYIGSIIGLLVLTPFADEMGKKFIFSLSQGLYVFGITLNLIGSYTAASWLIVIGQIAIGSGCYSVLIIGYVIISELTEAKFKQYSIITLNAVWAVAQILISGLFFWYNEWYNYVVIILLIPNIGIMLYSLFFLVESPYFLLEKKGDLQSAMKSMKTIAMYNGKGDYELRQVQILFKEALEDLEEQKRHGKSEVVSRFAIFKDMKYLKILLLVAVLEIGANAYYYGVQFSLGQVGTNFGYNILLTGIIETIAFFSSNLFITKVPRRSGMLIFNLICVGLGLLFFITWISDTTIAQTILLGVCRFFNAYTMSIVPMMQNECFPHRYRSIAWGYIEGLSQMGNFVTPYIVTACENADINPLIVFSFILAVVGTIPLLRIKQTLNVNQDEVDAQVEALKESIRTENSVQDALLNPS